MHNNLPNQIGPGPLPSFAEVQSSKKLGARFVDEDDEPETPEMAALREKREQETREELFRRLGIDLDETDDLDREDQGLKIIQQLRKDSLTVRVRRFFKDPELQSQLALCACVLILSALGNGLVWFLWSANSTNKFTQIAMDTLTLTARHAYDSVTLSLNQGRQVADLIFSSSTLQLAFAQTTVFPNSYLERLLVGVVRGSERSARIKACIVNEKESNTQMLCAGSYSSGNIYLGISDNTTKLAPSASRSCYREYSVTASDTRGIALCNTSTVLVTDSSNATCSHLNQLEPFCQCSFEPPFWSWYSAAANGQIKGPVCRGVNQATFSIIRTISDSAGKRVGSIVVEVTVKREEIFLETSGLVFGANVGSTADFGAVFLFDEANDVLFSDNSPSPHLQSMQIEAESLLLKLKSNGGLTPLNDYPYSSLDVNNGTSGTLLYAGLPIPNSFDSSSSAPSSNLSVLAVIPASSIFSITRLPITKTATAYTLCVLTQIIAVSIFLRVLAKNLQKEEIEASLLETEPRRWAFPAALIFVATNIIVSLAIFAIWLIDLTPDLERCGKHFVNLMGLYIDDIVDFRLASAHTLSQQAGMIVSLSFEQSGYRVSAIDKAVSTILQLANEAIPSLDIISLSVAYNNATTTEDINLVSARVAGSRIIVGVVDASTVSSDKSNNPTKSPCLIEYQFVGGERNLSAAIDSQCVLNGACSDCRDGAALCCGESRYWLLCAKRLPSLTDSWGILSPIISQEKLTLPAVFTVIPDGSSVGMPLVVASIIDVSTLPRLTGSDKIGFVIQNSAVFSGAEGNWDANLGSVAFSECFKNSSGCLVSDLRYSPLGTSSTVIEDTRDRLCNASRVCTDLKCQAPRQQLSALSDALIAQAVVYPDLLTADEGVLTPTDTIPVVDWRQLKSDRALPLTWFRILNIPSWAFLIYFVQSRDACVIFIIGFWGVAFILINSTIQLSIRRLFFFIGCKKKLHRIPMFSDCESDFIRDVTSKFKFEVANPKQNIVSAGAIGHEMYFINRGVVKVVSPNNPNVIIAQLSDKTFFGEIALLLEMPRTATIIASTYCDLTVLRKQDFLPLLSKYPDTKRKLTNFAKKRAEEIIRTQGINFLDLKHRKQTLRMAPGAANDIVGNAVVDNLNSPEWEARFRLASVHLKDALDGRALRHYGLDMHRLRLYHLYINPVFNSIGYICSILILCVSFFEPTNRLSVPTHSYSFDIPIAVESIALVALFLDELLNMLHLGLRRYFHSVLHIHALLAKIVIALDVIIAISVGPPVLRFSRIIRPMLIVFRSVAVRNAAILILKTIPKLADIGFLILSCLYAFATAGVLLFRDVYPWNKNDRLFGYWNTPESIAAFFILFNADGYPLLMLSAAEKSMSSTPIFIVFMLVSTFLFIPSLIGKFYESYKAGQSHIMRQRRRHEIANMLAAMNCLDIECVGSVKKAALMGFVLHFVSNNADSNIKIQDFDIHFKNLDSRGSNTVDRHEFLLLCKGFLPSLEKAHEFRKPNKPLRINVIRIFFDRVTHAGGIPDLVIKPAFQMIIQSFAFLQVFISGFHAAFFIDSFESTGKFLLMTDDGPIFRLSLFICFFFVVEIGIKAIGWSPAVFWRKGMTHKFDICVTLVAAVSIIVTLAFGRLDLVRSLFSLLHLRVFTVLPFTSHIVLLFLNLVTSTLPIIINGVIIMHTFCIFGMEIFGNFQKPLNSTLVKGWSDSLEVGVSGFNNMYASFLTMVQFITTTNFVAVIEPYIAQKGSVVYFFFFPVLLFWSLLFKNLIIGVVLDGFVFRLTQRDHRTAETRLWLNAHDLKAQETNACFICNRPKLEQERCIRPFECEHHFHRYCVLMYPHMRGTCPQCRLEKAAGSVAADGELLVEMYGQNVERDVNVDDVARGYSRELEEENKCFFAALQEFMFHRGFTAVCKVEKKKRRVFYRPGEVKLYKLASDFDETPVGITRIPLSWQRSRDTAGEEKVSKRGESGEVDEQVTEDQESPKKYIKFAKHDIEDKLTTVVLVPYTMHVLHFAAKPVPHRPECGESECSSRSPVDDAESDGEEEDEEDDGGGDRSVAEKGEGEDLVAPDESKAVSNNLDKKKGVHFSSRDSDRASHISLHRSHLGKIPHSLGELVDELQLWVVPQSSSSSRKPQLHTVHHIKNKINGADLVQIDEVMRLMMRTGDVQTFCRVLCSLAHLTLLTPEQASNYKASPLPKRGLDLDEAPPVIAETMGIASVARLRGLRQGRASTPPPATFGGRFIDEEEDDDFDEAETARRKRRSKRIHSALDMPDADSQLDLSDGENPTIRFNNFTGANFGSPTIFGPPSTSSPFLSRTPTEPVTPKRDHVHSELDRMHQVFATLTYRARALKNEVEDELLGGGAKETRGLRHRVAPIDETDPHAVC